MHECLHFKSYIQATRDIRPPNMNLLEFFYDQHLEEVFPNVNIALRIFFVMAVTNCSAERSFSCLKRIKNYLRSTIGQDRLNALALLCIESELVDAIDEFATLKSRRKMVS